MRFSHDCSECKPLGTWEGWDLYYCTQGAVGRPTLIARFGDEGPDYLTYTGAAALTPEIAECKRRAIAAGFQFTEVR